NLHGCRYPSRHDLQVGSWITLQLGENALTETATTLMRAQVKSVHLPQSPRELHHIGVELETPGNIWSIPAPPADWLQPIDRGFRGNGETAGATGPARTSVLLEMPKPPHMEEASEAEAEANESSEAAPAAENGPIPLPKPASKVAPSKTGRLVL